MHFEKSRNNNNEILNVSQELDQSIILNSSLPLSA